MFLQFRAPKTQINGYCLKCPSLLAIQHNSGDRRGECSAQVALEKRLCHLARLPVLADRAFFIVASFVLPRTLRDRFPRYEERLPAAPRGMCHIFNLHNLNDFGCKGTTFCRHMQDHPLFSSPFAVICIILSKQL